MAEDNLTGRMAALTDGVVAIGMTLLMLDIRLPEAVEDNTPGWSDLFVLHEQLWAYASSFLVVGLFWLIHVKRFRSLVRASNSLFWLNMVFLLVIGLVPFTTSLLASSGDKVAIQLYAGVMALASGALALMSLHVTSAGLHREDGKGEPLNPAAFLSFLTTGVFLLSIVISLWSVTAARWSWLLLAGAAVAPSLARRRET